MPFGVIEFLCESVQSVNREPLGGHRTLRVKVYLTDRQLRDIAAAAIGQLSDKEAETWARGFAPEWFAVEVEQ